MHLLPLNISERQASKLRRGHKVRVKHGKGFNVLVHPETYNLLTKTFKKNKGADLQLTDQELEANAGLTPEAHEEKINEEDDSFHLDSLFGGGSLFGNIRKGLTKFANGKTGKQLISVLKPVGKQLAKEGVNQLANGMNNSVDPKYKPLVSALTGVAANNANKQINGLGMHAEHGERLREMNKHLGTNYGYLHRAGLDNAISNAMSAGMSKSAIDMRHMVNPNHLDSDPMGPISRGNGVSLSSRRSRGIVQGRGAIHTGTSGHLPPALVSQPFGANFQFQHFFPPHMQNIRHADGKGLYA